MTPLVDRSVIVKWLHEDGESEVGAARRLLQTRRAGVERLLLLDLAGTASEAVAHLGSGPRD